ncbi:MAG: NAD-dependent epimerase/dehydratase family protein, partial [Candidatus Fonsibacter sp.]
MLRDNIVTVYGENAWRPYLHVLDAVNMIYLGLEKKLKGVYNLGNDDLNFTKKEIINKLLKNKSFTVKPIVWDDPRDYKVDFSKIKSVIDYEITFDLESGINELYSYMSSDEFKNKQNIKNNKFV